MQTLAVLLHEAVFVGAVLVGQRLLHRGDALGAARDVLQAGQVTGACESLGFLPGFGADHVDADVYLRLREILATA